MLSCYMTIFLLGNIEAAIFYQHRVQIKERMCAADKNTSKIIIIMVPRRIKTNALRNLVDATCIFLLNCTCTAFKAQHPQWRSEPSGPEDRGSQDI